jgi:hypothetical protein
MKTYEQLDAWKGCHTLALAVHHALREHARDDQHTPYALGHTSLRAAAKLAFGSGSRNRNLLRRSAEWSAGYLTEFGYHLAVARVTGLLPEDLCTKLDALRGRAAFYTGQLLDHLPPRPPAEEHRRP